MQGLAEGLSAGLRLGLMYKDQQLREGEAEQKKQKFDNEMERDNRKLEEERAQGRDREDLNKALSTKATEDIGLGDVSLKNRPTGDAQKINEAYATGIKALEEERAAAGGTLAPDRQQLLDSMRGLGDAKVTGTQTYDTTADRMKLYQGKLQERGRGAAAFQAGLQAPEMDAAQIKADTAPKVAGLEAADVATKQAVQPLKDATAVTGAAGDTLGKWRSMAGEFSNAIVNGKGEAILPYLNMPQVRQVVGVPEGVELSSPQQDKKDPSAMTLTGSDGKQYTVSGKALYDFSRGGQPKEFKFITVNDGKNAETLLAVDPRTAASRTVYRGTPSPEHDPAGGAKMDADRMLYNSSLENVLRGKVAKDLAGNEIWANPADKEAMPLFNQMLSQAWGEAKARKGGSLTTEEGNAVADRVWRQAVEQTQRQKKLGTIAPSGSGTGLNSVTGAPQQVPGRKLW